MGGADIGGDTSVEWNVLSDHVRQNPPPDHGPHGGAGWRHHGVDEADFNQSFTISIKIPNIRDNANTLANSLIQAANAAQAQAGSPGTRISFNLPIEGQSPDQIQIRWTSSNVPPGHRRPSLVAFAAAVRGAKARKNAAKKKAAKKKAAKKQAGKKRAAKKRR